MNRKRVVRLMQEMGIEAVYPKPRLSQPGEDHLGLLWLFVLKEGAIRTKWP